MADKFYAVYRQLKGGGLLYVPRTVTHSYELARDIAKGLTDGEITMPDGSTRRVTAYPHIAKEM